jgi:hypothetical protein
MMLGVYKVKKINHMKNFKINERVVCVGTFEKISGKSPNIGETSL